MYTEDFIKKTNNIIKAYKGYNIMKNGSKSDKFFAFLLFTFYIIASLLLVYSNYMQKDLPFIILSVFFWILAFVSLYIFHQNIYKRETKVYSRRSSKEINFLHYFEQEINNAGIEQKDYILYIDFFSNKADFENVFRNNEFVIYLSVIICPILINSIPDDKRVESLLLAVLGVFIIPGFIFVINRIINRKKYIYAGIIYYLKLGLLTDKFLESLKIEESK